MATTLYCRDTIMNGISGFRDAIITRGAASTTGVVNTTGSGTNIQWTKTAGGTAMAWISGRSPVGGWTLSGLVTVRLRALESAGQANAGSRIRLYKLAAAGGETELTGSPWDDGAEYTTSDAAYDWTFTPTSMAFAEDDRLIIRWFITNVGTMGAGRTCTMSYDGPSAAAAGDTFVTINENVTFKSEPPQEIVPIPLLDNGKLVLLHQYDGSDGSTTFTDSSPSAHVFTAQGNAQLDTAQFKFGTASALFNGSGDFIQGDGSSDFAFGRNDFTIDFWFRPSVFNIFHNLYDSRPSGTDGQYVTLYLDDDNALRYYVSSANRITGTTTLSANTWHHIALAREGVNTRLFLNGTQEGSTYVDINNYLNPASRPDIGVWSTDETSNPLNGHLDGLRVILGKAVWTTTFTPPSAAHTVNSDVGDTFYVPTVTQPQPASLAIPHSTIMFRTVQLVR